MNIHYSDFKKDFDADELPSQQVSIYDFLDKEKSQEVAPSELLPQVDETQVISHCGLTAFGGIPIKDIPCSDLDTLIEQCSTSKLISDNLVFNPDGYAEEVVKLPTEDTDSTLFSVGDVLTVKKASEVYDKYTHPEDYYHVLDHEGKSITIESKCESYEGIYYGTNLRRNGHSVVYFYHRELE